MKTAIIQRAVCENKTENRSALKAFIEEASCDQGAQLVVLSELHDTPYFCQTEDESLFDLAEPIAGGEACAFYSDLARSNRIVLVTSLFEKRATGLYHNTAVVFETDGSIAGVQRKMHIPDDPGYYEKFYFTPGDKTFRPIRTSAGILGVQTCWDQWYPEGARLMALQGAELLIYPTAIGYDCAEPDAAECVRQRNAWELVQRGHAVANGLPVVSVNRTGFEADPTGHTSGQRFWGSSFICGPQGEMLLQLDETFEGVRTINIDMRRSENVRRTWPFLRDRRIDAYEGLTERFID